MKTSFYLRSDATIDGRVIKGGDEIATLETPDGVNVNKIINAIVSGLATPNKPEPAPPAPAQSDGAATKNA